MLIRFLTISFIASCMILAIILQTTTPATIGPLGILIVFILMYMSVLSVLTFFIFSVSKLMTKISASVTVTRPMQPLTLRHAYYYASVLALAPVMLIGMQSVGDVAAYEVMLICIFIVIACVYIAKKSH